MAFFPVFLSVVYVMRNQGQQLETIIQGASAKLSSLVTDYELIIVDNASDDNSVNALKKLTGQSGYPNLQVYALIKEVDGDTASWVGLENALGDFVAVVDPLLDDIGFLPEMLDKAVTGADVVFANNQHKPRQSFAYRAAYAAFNFLYKSFNGIHLAKEAPQYRLLSKRVVNFILQHPQPAMTYRHLPATGGFVRINMEYSAQPLATNTKKLGESIDRGMRLLVSTTQAPMRLVTSLSLFGAAANLLYSSYVVAIGLFKADVAPGWVSMSLQQSGMFFLISLVLLVLGEYILHMTSLSNEGPLYHVGQEFTSVRMARREKLNIEDVSSSATKLSRNSGQGVA
ncbi:glycosyltransferase [Ochrobactrum sp. A-1]|uniref:glycosyltransferase n=1 Tax=Ochrobactrum sp. A-1 TaxID=2920940 RepID=UPI001F0B5093|nr:glycosyltransferase [Ochrobactrum sp. A-1]